MLVEMLTNLGYRLHGASIVRHHRPDITIFEVIEDDSTLLVEYFERMQLFGLASTFCEDVLHTEIWGKLEETAARVEEVIERSADLAPGTVSLSAFKQADRQRRLLSGTDPILNDYTRVCMAFKSQS